ncbi:MAG: hypothetical protein KDC52_20250 [Ignavibacteriae bacterium]|nr:hypothetical protein [Ignavibacteriota bacterium]MCB0753814.1 hypothetical protein [Ignavibacteriota bacterium]MCB9250186.1 hypothetical protein [Ignavibacteriales bacterium]
MNFQNIRYELKKEMTEKPKLKILLFWFLFSVLGVIIIKSIIRPKHLQLSESFEFLQGTLPNFFASAMIFVLAFVYYGAFYRNKNVVHRRIIFAFLFSFLGLTLWEYVQFFMGYPIDYFDILMTAIGNIFTIVIILLLKIK